MLVKGLEVIGFKCLGEGVSVEFVKGVRGVVGGKGRGKSNISDGMGWVVGEE